MTGSRCAYGGVKASATERKRDRTQWEVYWVQTLSSAQYQARDQRPAFLLHSTGHKPNGTEIDASINYADYYYLEALLRLQKLQQGKRL